MMTVLAWMRDGGGRRRTAMVVHSELLFSFSHCACNFDAVNVTVYADFALSSCEIYLLNQEAKAE